MFPHLALLFFMCALTMIGARQPSTLAPDRARYQRGDSYIDALTSLCTIS